MISTNITKQTQKKIVEFGDFQTPLALAQEVVAVVCSQFPNFKTVIEPTCGIGTFLLALFDPGVVNDVTRVIGMEINPEYVSIAKERITPYQSKTIQLDIQEQDFFKTNWEQFVLKLPSPILFIGNPPWVTNSQLGKIAGENVPQKWNLKRHSGIDAMTGHGNFDISESMLIQLATLIADTDAAMAFLVKTSVARKVFEYLSARNMTANMQIRWIDAKKYFNVSVDACLFYMEGVKHNEKTATSYECSVYESLQSEQSKKNIGIINRNLVSDVKRYKNRQAFDSKSPIKWRSGVKHDCAKVMELRRCQAGFLNGLGETVVLTEEYIYPLLKSSDVAGDKSTSDRFVIVPQRYIGESTEPISRRSPKTWQYLNSHVKLFQDRKSSIYRNSPLFSVFGVGDYTFKPWKVAVSGLYKDFHFRLIPPKNGKPVILDDTCYFLGFDTEEEAVFVHKLLTTVPVSEFLDSVVFRDDKRPLTAKVLNRLDLQAVAKFCHKHEEFQLKILNKCPQKQLF